jgi:hypothetical protein
MGRTLKMLAVCALYARVCFTVSRVPAEGRGRILDDLTTSP